MQPDNAHTQFIPAVTEPAEDTTFEELRAEIQQLRTELDRQAAEADRGGFFWDWEGFISALIVIGSFIAVVVASISGD